MAAMARSLTALLFLLLASTALAARDLPEVTSSLDEACDNTRFPDLCARILMAYPDSRTATPRRLAKLSVLAALDAGRAAAEFAHDALIVLTDGDEDSAGQLQRCLDTCSADVEEAVAQLSALSREPTDARFLEVEAWLSATLDAEANYEAVCKDAPAGEVKRAAVARSAEFDMMLRVALDLIAEAAFEPDGSVALPPSELPAFGGAPSDTPGYGFRRPRPRPRRAPAPAPMRGYSHRRPRPRAPAPAPSPLVGGGYGARMPVAPAPAPFGRSRPRLRPRPRAPAPAPSPLVGGGYGARMPVAPTPAPLGRPRPRPRAAPAPARSPLGAGYGARRPRPPAPAPLGAAYGRRRPRAPAPSPFRGQGAPARSPAYGARRPRPPAPARAPKPFSYAFTFGTDETE